MGLTEKLETLPVRPGVYMFKDGEGHVLYVGKARVLRDRVRSYFQAGRPVDPQRGDLVGQIADLDLVVTDTEMEALALENNFIKRHQPRYNILLRDDKNHPYLKLTLDEEYPRIYVVRRVAEDGNAYGGPYIPAKLGRRTASMVHRIFGIRSCKETLNGRRPRPCLQYQIKRCLAPCVAEICSLDRYHQAAQDARLFLEGRTDEVVKSLRAQMEEAAQESRFEEAATLRDHIRALDRLEAPQKITTTDIDERDLFGAHVEWERGALQVFSVREGKVVGREGYLVHRVPEPERFLASAIQQYYADGQRYVPREVLVPAEIPDRGAARGVAERAAGEPGAHPHPPARREGAPAGAGDAQRDAWPSTSSGAIRAPSRRRSCAACRTCSSSRSSRGAMECFDISNIQGSDVVASMVVFEDGLPKKSDYRKFRVQGHRRRPGRLRLHARGGGPPLPAAAGGGQGAARPRPDRRRQGTALRGHGGAGRARARRPARGQPGQARGADLRARARGAGGPARGRRRCCSSCSACATRRTGSRSASTARRARSARLRSELDDIPGIGPIKRRKLLSRFGSLRGVRGASIEELATAVGRAVAVRIRAWMDRAPGPPAQA